MRFICIYTWYRCLFVWDNSVNCPPTKVHFRAIDICSTKQRNIKVIRAFRIDRDVQIIHTILLCISIYLTGCSLLKQWWVLLFNYIVFIGQFNLKLHIVWQLTWLLSSNLQVQHAPWSERLHCQWRWMSLRP